MQVRFDQPAKKIHNFIRGLDSSPGAWAKLDSKQIKLFNSKLWHLEVSSINCSGRYFASLY